MSTSVLDQMRKAIQTTNVKFTSYERFKNRVKELPDHDYTELETYLQGLFYPTKKNDVQVYNDLTNKIKEHLEGILDKKIKDFSFNQETFSSSEEANPIEIIAKYEQFSHKKHIEYATVERRLKEVEAALRKPNLTEDQIKNLNKLCMNIYKLLYNEEDSIETIEKKKQKIKVFTKLKNGDLIDAIDQMFKDNSYFKEVKLQSWIKGQIFEKSLDFFSLLTQEGIDKTNDELLKIVFDERKQGTNSASRENLTESKYGITVGKKDKSFEISVGDKSVKITNEFSPRQGKMDIEFNLPSSLKLDSDTLRVSAKNWQTINEKHDFGSSNLAGMLLRTADIDDTLLAGLAKYLYEHSKTKTQKLIMNYNNHKELIKQAVFLDTVMGYSQKTGYADYLIVNDRANSKIRVFSIRKIYNKFMEKENNIIYLKDYNKYENKAFKNNMRLSNNTFISKILSEFKKYELAISANILLEENNLKI